MSTSNINTISGIQSFSDIQERDIKSNGNNKMDQDAFLRLLTTQLQNQDPLNPLDNTEFVAQLSQFSSLEQLTQANSNLQNMTLGIDSVSSATMVDMIGREVVAIGNTFSYDSSDKTLSFDLNSDAEQVSISIRDSSGKTVFQDNIGALGRGEQSYTWTGVNNDGIKLEEGEYSFFIEATNAEEPVDVTTYIRGMVDQIDYSTGIPAPRVDGQTITVDRIVRVVDATSNDDTSDE